MTRNPVSLRSVLVACMTVVASGAAAQTPGFVTLNTPYVPLTLTSPGYTSSTVSFVDTDENGTIVALPFAFPWFGQNYSSVLVQTNGFISFDLSQCLTNAAPLCNGNIALPGAMNARNAIFGWWDDLEIVNGATVTTHSSPTEFVVQYNNAQGWASSTGPGPFSVNFQIRLTPAGTAVIHYGAATGTQAFATAGFQDDTGTKGALVLPKLRGGVAGTCNSVNQTGCCGNAGVTLTPPACELSDLASGLQVRIGDTTDADLAVPTVGVSNLQIQSNGSWTFDVQGTIRNFGQTTAAGFLWRTYLSTDAVWDPTDVQVGEGGPVTVAAGASQAVTGSAATLPGFPVGSYYVLIKADPTNVVTEATKANNVGVSPAPVVSGVDLVALTVLGVLATAAGNTDNVQISFTNRGATAPSAVTLRVLLSANTTFDASDFVLTTLTRQITGGQTINETIPVTTPAAAPAGDFYYLLQVDSAGAIVESNETNNVVASSSRVTVRRPDLVAESLDVVDPTTGASARVARFGDVMHVKAYVSNTGAVSASNFNVGIVLSPDSSLSLLSDTVACEQPVAVINATELRRLVSFDCRLPYLGADGKNLNSGQYFVFLVADSRGQVFETVETNNAFWIGPVRVTAPTADLTVSNVTAPAVAGVGEILPVTRTMRNVGNVDAPAVAYRYFASVNDIITPDDIPLTILATPASTPAVEGSVTLASGAVSTLTELVQLPSTMLPGTYYLGAIVDPLGVVPDLDPTNNARASRVVQVAASVLKVATTALPDAAVGRPYLFRLAALGEDGPSTWTIEGSAPAWLTITAEGLLSGTPALADVGVAAVTFSVSNHGRQSLTRLVLRTLPSTSQLDITTTSLPPVTNNAAVVFSATLGAAGGVRPYQWRVASGLLPIGMTLSADGVLSGAPQRAANQIVSFVAEVRDAVGGRAQRELKLRLIAPGAIAITKVLLPDALVGGDYLEDIAVENTDHSPLATPVKWTLTGTLPAGLALTEQTEVATVAGHAAAAGAFSFTLSVEDANGRTDSVDYSLVVHAPRYRVLGTLPELLRPAEAVHVQLQVAPASAVKYRIIAGSLPPGVTLTEDGLISGVVSDEGDGQWTSVVEARDAAGASGLVPLATRVEREARKQGCSVGGGWSGLALLALLGLFRKGRRGRLAGALVASLPLAALAQYQVVGPTATPFQALGTGGLPAGQVVSAGSSITLPFDFPFYSTKLNTLGFSAFGYLAVGGATATDQSNETIPHSVTSPLSARAFIAPWWDTLGTVGARYTFAVAGAAPNRVAIIEWAKVPPYSGSAVVLNFQARLYEGTGRIQFLYDTTPPNSSSASVGIQGDLGNGVAGMACSSTANCGAPAYLSGASLDFFRPPDLEVAALSVPQLGYTGVSFPATATVRNSGGRQAANVDVTFYLSTDGTLDSSDVSFGTASTTVIEAGQTAQLTSTSPLPSSLNLPSYFVIAVVDASNVVPEQNEANNVSGAVPLTLGPPTPDLSATAISAPATGQPGAVILVSRTLKNLGNAPASNFKYSYFLSTNSVASLSDGALSPVGSVATLAAGATDQGMDSLTLPANLATGNYWLGVCANYDSGSSSFGLTEITLVNDCVTSPIPILVATTALDIVTAALPPASQFAPWGLRLQATGGLGSYAWDLSPGSTLPAGISLSAQGELQGAPAAAGTFAFDVRVTSGSLSAVHSYSLMVSAGTLPLAVVDQQLTSAGFGRSYVAPLVAAGGSAPYAWGLKSGALPPGLAIATDGLLEGRPAVSGDFSFVVEVVDSKGQKASRELTLSVVTPPALVIATRALPEATLQREYLQPLVALGGKAPYAWSIDSAQRLAQNVTEVPGDVLRDPAAITALLASAGLTVESGSTQAFVRGVPVVAGVFTLGLKVTDTAGASERTNVVLRIGYVDGLAITTTMLPDAFYGEPYGPMTNPIRLSHNGGRDALGVRFEVPCVEQAVRAGNDTRPPEFACTQLDPIQMLPPGIILAADGSLSGTPNGGLGTYTFLVKLTDAANRQDLRALSIRVRDYNAAPARGCTATPGPLWAALVLVAGALALRRKGRTS